MATWGFYSSAASVPSAISTQGAPVRVISRVIDYSLSSIGATDVVQALEVPDNHLVLQAGIEVLTADTAGNSGTVALGLFSGIAAGGFVAAAAPTTVGQMASITVPASGFSNEGTGTADSIDITGATGVINAKLRVWAVVVDLGKGGGTSANSVVPVSGTSF